MSGPPLGDRIWNQDPEKLIERQSIERLQVLADRVEDWDNRVDSAEDVATILREVARDAERTRLNLQYWTDSKTFQELIQAVEWVDSGDYAPESVDEAWESFAAPDSPNVIFDAARRVQVMDRIQIKYRIPDVHTDTKNQEIRAFAGVVTTRDMAVISSTDSLRVEGYTDVELYDGYEQFQLSLNFDTDDNEFEMNRSSVYRYRDNSTKRQRRVLGEITEIKTIGKANREDIYDS